MGGTQLENLTLATGHGTLGWTMAPGTGRAIADLLSGKKPEIDFEGLTAARYAT
jgi:D-amino-acid dehydrogenase